MRRPRQLSLHKSKERSFLSYPDSFSQELSQYPLGIQTYPEYGHRLDLRAPESAMLTHSLLYSLPYPMDPKNHPAPLRVAVDHSLGVAEKGLGPHSKTREGQRDRENGASRDPRNVRHTQLASLRTSPHCNEFMNMTFTKQTNKQKEQKPKQSPHCSQIDFRE